MSPNQIDKEENVETFHEWLRLVELKSNSEGEVTMVFEVKEEFIEQFRNTYGFNCAPSLTGLSPKHIQGLEEVVS